MFYVYFLLYIYIHINIPIFICSNNCIDCGSGIGRVTKCTLAPRFEYITCVEQSPRLINATVSYLSKKSAHGDPKCVKHYNQGKVVWPLVNLNNTNTTTASTTTSSKKKKGDTSTVLELSKKLLVCDAVTDVERRVECLNMGLQHFLAPTSGGTGTESVTGTESQPSTTITTTTTTATTSNRKYDCIWIQWVIGHLSDPDYIQFLQ